MGWIESWLHTLPPLAVAGVVCLIIGLESMGIPLPGELTLVTASVMASTDAINPWLVASAAAIGAIIGDSIGYAIGRRFGKPLFERLGRRFPKHFGPHHVLFAERVFTRYGVYAVFFGRFVALLRILAGPLAGALKMQYGKFLAANVLGGIAWAGGTTAAIYSLGIVAEVWLKRFSWIGLLVAILGGLTIGYLVKRKTERMARRYAEEEAAKLVAEEPAPAGGSAGA